MGSQHQSMADSLGRINPEIDVDASPMSSAGWGSLSPCWDEGGKAGMKVESPTSSPNPTDEGFRYKYRWLPTGSWQQFKFMKANEIFSDFFEFCWIILNFMTLEFKALSMSGWMSQSESKDLCIILHFFRFVQIFPEVFRYIQIFSDILRSFHIFSDLLKYF